MGEAAEKLKVKAWKDAIRRSRRHCSTCFAPKRLVVRFRLPSVVRGGGGGGGGAGRDLESLFDLELDTEKNQYETGAQTASADQRRKKSMRRCRSWSSWPGVSRSLRNSSGIEQQSPQQRWQQEMLRREAEELRKKMEEMARRSAGQQGQQAARPTGSTGTAGTAGQQGQQGQRDSQGQPAGQSGGDPK